MYTCTLLCVCACTVQLYNGIALSQHFFFVKPLSIVVKHIDTFYAHINFDHGPHGEV